MAVAPMISISSAFDPEGKPRKPGLLCIGAQKSGTSWLAQMLGQHPQIWIPPFKEVQFFNYRFLPGHRRWIGWHYRNKPDEIRKRHAMRGFEMPAELDAYLDGLVTGQMFHNHWYKRVFAPAPPHAIAADFTPEYSGLPEEGVDFVAEFLPKTRIIYLIRHPVDRAISQLKMNLSREKRHPASLEEWLAEVENPVLDERGDYARYLPRWRKRFPDMLVLPYGRIARDPADLIAEIEDYLQIGPYLYHGLGNRVFVAPKGFAPPPEAIARLSERLAPQIAFLNAEMGADFTALIR